MIACFGSGSLLQKIPSEISNNGPGVRLLPPLEAFILWLVVVAFAFRTARKDFGVIGERKVQSCVLWVVVYCD